MHFTRLIRVSLRLKGKRKFDLPEDIAEMLTPEALEAVCASTYIAKGVAYNESGNSDLAIATFTEAIALNPNFAEAYYHRGLTHAKNGEFDKAIKDYTEAIELKPDYADAYYNRGAVWLSLGKRDKAKADLIIARSMGVDAITTLDKILQDYERAWKILGNV